VLGEEPGPGLPNQHTKACPRFQTMHCWCPPATGPGQPHEKDCSHFKKVVPCEACGEPLIFIEASTDTWMCDDTGCLFFGAQQHSKPILHATIGSYQYKHDWDLTEPIFDHGVSQAQAYNHALQWLDKQKPQSFVHAPLSVECNCAAFEDADIGHDVLCPIGAAAGEKAESDAADDPGPYDPADVVEW
jgi:hypothetical protein